MCYTKQVDFPGGVCRRKTGCPASDGTGIDYQEETVMDMEMSMDIIEMARDLGRALQADEKYQRYVNATLENDKDQVLQDLIGKFNTLRVDINREISKSEKDQEKIARLDSEF